MMFYHLITLGCQMNLSDSERLHTVIRGLGYVHTDHEEEASLLGIVACSVRQKAIDKVYSRISKWNKWKNDRNLITFVSGCVLPADRKRFIGLFDLVFDISNAEDLPDMIRNFGVITPVSLRKPDYLGMPANEKIFSLWNLTPTYQSDFEAYIPIQNGCDKFCTFCAVPYTRGREVSRPSSEIIDEAKKLIRSGYKSITLLGQNVNSYGHDRKGAECSFTDLLRKIAEEGEKLGREFLVYYTSPHPRDMGIELVEAMASSRFIGKQVHLPMQSGDDEVLVRMNRKHGMERYRELVGMIREKMPEATLFTDIIVGFPGETEQQFLNTAEAMKEFRFNMAYIAQYSPRPGAASQRWSDDIPAHEKKRRLHYLSDILEGISLEYNKGLTGKEMRVLVTGLDRKDGYLSGLTEGRIVARFPSGNKDLVGRYTNIRVTDASAFSIEGEIV